MPVFQMPQWIFTGNIKGLQEENKNIFFSVTHLFKDTNVFLVKCPRKERQNSSRLKRSLLLAPLRNNKRQNKFIPQRAVISHACFSNLRGRGGRRMEARIPAPVFPRSSHLFTCTFICLMNRARDKWSEKLERSFLRCFPVEAGCVFPIPFRPQPASEPSCYPRNTAFNPQGLWIPWRDIMGISWRGCE